MSKATRFAFIAGAVLALFLSSKAEAEFYFNIYTGASLTHDNDLHVEQPGVGTDITFGGVSYSGAPFQSPPYYGLRLGYYFEDLQPFGVEVDFLHYKVIADTAALVDVNGTYLGVPESGSQPLNTFVRDFEISNGVNYFSLNVTARQGFMKDQRVPEGRVQVYGGLGLAAVRLVPDMFLQGGGGEMEMESTWDGPGYNAFIGARIFPTDFWQDPDLSIFAEYRFTYIDADIPAPLSGSAELSIATHHFIMGLGVHF